MSQVTTNWLQCSRLSAISLSFSHLTHQICVEHQKSIIFSNRKTNAQNSNRTRPRATQTIKRCQCKHIALARALSQIIFNKLHFANRERVKERRHKHDCLPPRWRPYAHYFIVSISLSLSFSLTYVTLKIRFWPSSEQLVNYDRMNESIASICRWISCCSYITTCIYEWVSCQIDCRNGQKCASDIHMSHLFILFLSCVSSSYINSANNLFLNIIASIITLTINLILFVFNLQSVQFICH